MRQASLELEIREDILIVGVNNPLLRNYPSVSFAQLFESLAVSVEWSGLDAALRILNYFKIEISC